jgi:hypothetical protein
MMGVKQSICLIVYFLYIKNGMILVRVPYRVFLISDPASNYKIASIAKSECYLYLENLRFS